MEGAIGQDCRRLADGRTAVFKHTSLHRRIRRDFFERRDVLSIMQASLVATASLSAHPRFNPETAANEVLESRKMLIRTAFPYLEIEPTVKKEENYDAYFDELDAILAAQKEPQAKAAAVGDQAEK